MRGTCCFDTLQKQDITIWVRLRAAQQATTYKLRMFSCRAASSPKQTRVLRSDCILFCICLNLVNYTKNNSLKTILFDPITLLTLSQRTQEY